MRSGDRLGEQEPLQVAPGKAPSAAACAQVIGWGPGASVCRPRESTNHSSMLAGHLWVAPGKAPSAAARAQVIGWENIELISDRPLEMMLEDMARLKAEYPDRRGPLP